MHRFTYHRAANAASAVEAFAAAGGNARFLAGGTTLYDLMKLEVETPERIVDINGLTELSRYSTEGDEITLGALARMSDVAADPVLVSDFPVLSEALWKAASGQLRNMASLGGNLLQRTRCAYFRHGRAGGIYPCNKRVPGSGCAAIGGLDRPHALLGTSENCIATYPGDFAVALAAFDTQVDLVGPDGARTIAFHELHREPGDTPERENNLSPGELITAIRIPKTAAARRSTYHKIRDRESYAFAIASAAVALDLDGTRIVAAHVAVGGVATRPWRAETAEAELVGRDLDEAVARRAGEVAFSGARAGNHNAGRIELGIRTVADAVMIAGRRN